MRRSGKWNGRGRANLFWEHIAHIRIFFARRLLTYKHILYAYGHTISFIGHPIRRALLRIGCCSNIFKLSMEVIKTVATLSLGEQFAM